MPSHGPSFTTAAGAPGRGICLGSPAEATGHGAEKLETRAGTGGGYGALAPDPRLQGTPGQLSDKEDITL